MAVGLETASNPLALRRGFDQDPCSRAGPEHRGEPIPVGANPLLDQLRFGGQDADLAVGSQDLGTPVYQEHSLLGSLFA